MSYRWVQGRFWSGPEGSLGKSHFVLCWKVKLSIVQGNMDVFSFVWFCEALGGHSIGLLFIGLRTIYVCETVRRICHQHHGFLNTFNIESLDQNQTRMPKT